ncbi:SusD-like protein [bioreactor metagenome]|uniref:SusD-like protein n=1 Tax=bioreactor metagenome TaxID=1076179 RepID=A0A644WRN1_9ZZZZ
MKKYILASFIISSFILSSCNDFLDDKPTGTMTTDSELSSKETAEAIVNSVYVNSNIFTQSTPGWGCNSILLLEYMTGKTVSENSQANHKEFQDLLVSEKSLYIEDWWRECYSGIAKCNLALQKLPEYTKISQSLVNQYMGETRFMRALYYFYLVRIFGDLPKIKTLQTQIGELMVFRSPIKEIYDEIIIPDLLDAEKSGLPFTNNTGRVSMAAVKSLLADVYLTYAGFPIKGGTQYYAESAKRSLELIESNKFKLFETYEDLHTPANNNIGENIFQVQFAIDKRHSDVSRLCLPSRSGVSAYDLEYGSLIPTDEFVKSYAPGDKRAEEKQFFFRTYKGHPTKFSPGAPELEFMDLKGYYIYKFHDKEAVDKTAKSNLNWTIYRYADVLLMYAEAQVNADNQANQTAIDALNQIRYRANLQPFTKVDKTSFEKEVWDQRYFELCYENKNWFDMLRTRMIRNDKSGLYDPFVGHTTIFGKIYTETQLLFPIPLSEMQANPNLKQNNGY